MKTSKSYSDSLSNALNDILYAAESKYVKIFCSTQINNRLLFTQSFGKIVSNVLKGITALIFSRLILYDRNKVYIFDHGCIFIYLRPRELLWFNLFSLKIEILKNQFCNRKVSSYNSDELCRDPKAANVSLFCLTDGLIVMKMTSCYRYSTTIECPTENLKLYRYTQPQIIAGGRYPHRRAEKHLERKYRRAGFESKSFPGTNHILLVSTHSPINPYIREIQ